MRVGILSAMSEEIEALVSDMSEKKIHSQGMREYHEGLLWDHPAVLAFSRWGKVAAATTVTHMISRFKVDAVLFTGVAGGVTPDLRLGDIVVGTDLIQHDMDARPLFERCEIPLLGMRAFETNLKLREDLQKAAARFVDGATDAHGFVGIPHEPRREFGIAQPQVRMGRIASGDQFFASQEKIRDLRERLPDVLCVEMEGAAVAQVCHEHDVPFAIVRTISDSADEHAPIDFPKFVRQIARVYSHGILRNMGIWAAGASQRC